MRPSGGPTKDEILAVTFFKMALRPGDLFMDIGCGTGKVSLHAARIARKVCSIDLRQEAIAFSQKEAERKGLTNIEFHEGNAADLIPLLPRPDCAFVGGSTDIDVTLSLLARRNLRTVVVNAVRIDTINTAVSLMQDLGIYREAVYVQVSHATPIGPGYMWKPANPVAIIVGGAQRC